MRLLNVNSLDFTRFHNDDRPPYVIASHQWVSGFEATLKDVRKRRNTNGIGFEKVKAFAKYIRESVPSVEWLWIDTCCINQEDAAELSEAVNLMFEWYRDAQLCIAYLADVERPEDKNAFERSVWHLRGWTLQELLAPRTVVFVTKHWQVIGNKGGVHCCDSTNTLGPGLEREVAAITGIPEQVLHDYSTSVNVSDEEKLKWMDCSRETTREEDMSYALYGIFGVTPGANYGEKKYGARKRLMEAIRREHDQAAEQTEVFRKIATWLSPPDPWTNHESARQRHEPETGAWLLQSAQYKSWTSGLTRNLWVYGKAGCGKTILCSTAIEDIRAHCRSATNTGYAIFYFSFSDDRKQSYEQFLRSLAAQLCWKDPGLSMLQQAYDRGNRSFPNLNELEKILSSSIESYEKVFLLLDALDECPLGQARSDILECLERLSESATQLRVLATSRNESDVGESMEIMKSVVIPAETLSVDADIQKYLSTQLARDRKLRCLDSATKALVEKRISRNSDGMFRWAYCQLQELKTLPSMKPKYVRATLESLPLTLDATYERMLGAIKPIFRREALVLLRWLAYARSPPSLGELAEAAITDPEEDAVRTEERGGLEDTLNILSGLVMVHEADLDDGAVDDATSLNSQSELSDRHDSEREDDEIARTCRGARFRKDTKIRLAHFSVKEFLESKRILHGEAGDFYLQAAMEHRFIAQSCLAYLTYYSRSAEKLSTEQDLETFPLLKYAAVSWVYHSGMQRVGDFAREIAFLSAKDALRDWLLVHSPDRFWIRPFGGGHAREIGSGLYYASYTGLETVVSGLLESGADVNARGGEYGNALQAASFKRHEKVVQMLLNEGADVNASGGFYHYALQAPAAEGSVTVVQMLIDAGAEVNAVGVFGSSALQKAAANGHENVVRMLLDVRADVDAGWPHTALYEASTNGHDKVVWILIEAGADVNTLANYDSPHDSPPEHNDFDSISGPDEHDFEYMAELENDLEHMVYLAELEHEYEREQGHDAHEGELEYDEYEGVLEFYEHEGEPAT